MNTKVLSSAGSGKTTYILNCIKNINPKKKTDILVLMFSTFAKNDFIERMKQQNIDAVFSTLQVRTLHSAAGSILKSFNGSTTTFINLAIWKAKIILDENPMMLQQYSVLRNIKHLFVDEAQDLSRGQYDLVIAIQKITKANLTMVGDVNQCIYQFQGSDSKLLEQFTAHKIINLQDNYRSTQSVLNVANAIVKDRQIKCMGNKINKPVRFFFLKKEEILNEIVQEISKHNPQQYGNIAIIGPVKLSKGVYEKGKNIGLQCVRNHLCEKQIPAIAHYKITTSEEIGHKKDNIVNDKVNIMTVHSTKGLEFDTVILIDFHFRLQNTIPSVDDIAQHNNLLYVAVTRAKTNLLIFSVQDNENQSEVHPLFSDIRQHCQVTYGKADNNINQPIDNYQYSEYERIETAISIIAKNAALQANICQYLEIVDDINGISKDIIGDFIIMEKNTSLLDTWEYRDFITIVGEYMEIYLAFCIYGEQIIDNIIDEWNNTSYVYVKDKLVVDGIQLVQSKQQQAKQIMDQLQLSGDTKKKIKDELDNGKTVVLVNEKHKDKENTFKEALITMGQQLVSESIYQHDKLKTLFMIKVQEFIFQHDAGHMLVECDQYGIFNEIQLWFDDIKTIAAGYIGLQNTGSLRYQTLIASTQLNMNGRMDFESDDEIIEIKFSTQLRAGDYLQLYLYGLINDPFYQKKRTIINLRTGEIHCVQFNQNIHNKLFISIIQHAKIMIQQGIILYDFETTGLDKYTCKITDRCFYDINFNVYLSDGLCQAGIIPMEITELTGITTEMSANGDKIQCFVNDIITIKDIYDKPIVSAYYGRQYDDIILNNLMRKFGYNINEHFRFADAQLVIVDRFRIHHEIINKKMQTIYNQLFADNTIIQDHRAHGDVNMMVDMFKKLSIEYDLLDMFTQDNN